MLKAVHGEFFVGQKSQRNERLIALLNIIISKHSRKVTFDSNAKRHEPTFTCCILTLQSYFNIRGQELKQPLEREYKADKSVKSDKNEKSDQGSQLLGPEDELIDVGWQKNGSFFSKAELLTVVQQHIAGARESAATFPNNFANMFSLFAK